MARSERGLRSTFCQESQWAKGGEVEVRPRRKAVAGGWRGSGRVASIPADGWTGWWEGVDSAPELFHVKLLWAANKKNQTGGEDEA